MWVRVDLLKRHLCDVPQHREGPIQTCLKHREILAQYCLLCPHDNANERRALSHNFYLREVENPLHLVTHSGDEKVQVFDSHAIDLRRITQGPVVEYEVD